MRRRDYLWLALLGLAAVALVGAFQPSPGYMDADYYYAGGLQLAAGRGFSEPYLWNYLDDPAGLPHPSHSYWLPLTSILAALIPALFGPDSWFAARIPFFLAAACIPPLTAALAFSITSRRFLALTSGLLAVFSGLYLPFLATTDTFALYMLFGGLFFLLVARFSASSPLPSSFLLGLLSALLHLSRADGLMWLFLAFIVILSARKPNQSLLSSLFSLLSALAGYLLLMAPWFARNYAAFGSLLAPGSSKMLWLTAYDQIFAYPASLITFEAWWSSGLGEILQARLWALGLNAANTLTVQGGIFLLPLIVLGIWQTRRNKVTQLALLAWLLTLAAMTLVFPFAGARGSYFHSGAALQMVWWALAPLGLERLLEWGRARRGWELRQARPLFTGALVGLAVLLTGMAVALRLPSWGNEHASYSQTNQYLVEQGMSDEAVVMVANPPGFYLASGNPAIAVPACDPLTLLDLARRYRAEYLILEQGSIPASLMPVYENPAAFPGLTYLGEVENARLYAIQP